MLQAYINTQMTITTNLIILSTLNLLFPFDVLGFILT